MEKQAGAFSGIAAELEQARILESLHESDYRHTQLIQNLAAAVYTCDAEGYIKFYNKAAVELWGREPVVGKDLWCGSWKIFEPDNITPMPLDTCPMAIALKEGRTVRGQEIIVERPDGVRRNVMPHPDPIFDSSGKVVEAVNMLVDITDIKQNEKALRESEERYRHIAEELEKRVEERTSDLKEANLTLQQNNAELEQFAFIASHDMQEPLRKIKTFASRLESRSAETMDEVGRNWLAKIKKSAERMTNLIKGILDYSRLDHLQKQFEPTDLNDILKRALNDLELTIEEKNAKIHHGNLPVVNAIPLQMDQLFHNLINNGLKFCKNDIPCELAVTSRMLNAKEVAAHQLNKNVSYCEIIFQDNGIGFQEQYAESVFQIFERLNTRDKYDGTGIGLALCRKIVSLHHGKIFAESKVHEGTAIHVILPL